MPPGVYSLTEGPLVLAGPGVTHVTEASPGEIVFTPSGVFRAVEISGSGRVNLQSLTFDGGNSGGGILIDGAQGVTVALSEVRMRFDAAAGRGGGIEMNGGRLWVFGGVFDSNTSGEGGGLFARGPFHLLAVGTRFVANVASTEGGAASLDLSDPAAWARFHRVRFYENDGGFVGGGLSARGDSATGMGGTVAVVDSLFDENRASSDGAAASTRDGAAMELQGTTVSANLGLGTAAALAYADAPGSLQYVTVADNVSLFEGVRVLGGASPQALWMDHTVVTRNVPGPDLDAFGSIAHSGGYNYIQRMQEGAAYLAAPSDITGTLASPAPNPMLGPLADNGGPFPTHLPQLGSLLVESGSPIAPTGALAVDVRGARRHSDANCDGKRATSRGAVARAECENGCDDDADGMTDHPADLQCDGPQDREPPQCGDGDDNDGDQFTDFPADVACRSALDNDERCGLGAELGVVVPLLFALRRRRLARRRRAEARGASDQRASKIQARLLAVRR